MGKQNPIIIANWKMYKTAQEAKQFLETLHTSARVKVWIAPPFTAIAAAVETAQKGVMIGAQNMHEAEEGAFTGEVSARMLKSLGAQFVILGHSERRRLYHESDPLVAQKVGRAQASGLVPVVCIGETEEERRLGKTEAVLRRQLEAIELKGEMVIAYEPVWAIGTGQAATPEIAAATHAAIRKMVGQETIPLIYGGSVKPDNAPTFLKQPHIDGLLIGGASLDVHQLNQIMGAV
jgi:triosephosphate isomerase